MASAETGRRELDIGGGDRQAGQRMRRWSGSVMGRGGRQGGRPRAPAVRAANREAGWRAEDATAGAGALTVGVAAPLGIVGELGREASLTERAPGEAREGGKQSEVFFFRNRWQLHVIFTQLAPMSIFHIQGVAKDAP